ncbi:MAG: hypothetical protein MUF74_01945 [Cypionkella sp.]|jgi:hypothetical protein|nr:hypothetical protein [Cypionkella sp.]
MTQKAEELFASLAEMFSPSAKRYAESLAPLMPKRDATASHSTPRRVSVFGHAA